MQTDSAEPDKRALFNAEAVRHTIYDMLFVHVYMWNVVCTVLKKKASFI